MLQAVFLDGHVARAVRLIYHPCQALAGPPEQKNIRKQGVMKPQKSQEEGTEKRRGGGSVKTGAPECPEGQALSHTSVSVETASW